MSQDALGQLKHLKTARARWPFSDEPCHLHIPISFILICHASPLPKRGNQQILSHLFDATTHDYYLLI